LATNPESRQGTPYYLKILIDNFPTVRHLALLSGGKKFLKTLARTGGIIQG